MNAVDLQRRLDRLMIGVGVALVAVLAGAAVTRADGSEPSLLPCPFPTDPPAAAELVAVDIPPIPTTTTTFVPQIGEPASDVRPSAAAVAALTGAIVEAFSTAERVPS